MSDCRIVGPVPLHTDCQPDTLVALERLLEEARRGSPFTPTPTSPSARLP
jgi:hypothetical protein